MEITEGYFARIDNNSGGYLYQTYDFQSAYIFQSLDRAQDYVKSFPEYKVCKFTFNIKIEDIPEEKNISLSVDEVEEITALINQKINTIYVNHPRFNRLNNLKEKLK